jgi:large subunit ribosomal protein L29
MSKKIDFLKSIKEMNEADLKARIQEDELRLKKLTFAHAVSPLENPMTIRGVRKDLARLKTQLKNKQSQAKESVPAETTETTES